MRYRVTIALDVTDRDTTADDVAEAARLAVNVMTNTLGGFVWVDIDGIEELGT